MINREKELIRDQRIILNTIEKYVAKHQLHLVGEFFPGFLHFNRKDDLHIQYMNPKGLEKVDLPLSYIQENGAAFFTKYVHPKSVAEVFPRFIDFYNRNETGRTYADCQEILNPYKKEFYQMLTVTKVVKDLNGLMSMSLPVNELGPNIRKIKGLVGVDPFYEKNFLKFQSLTNREVEILKWIVKGHTSRSIAGRIHISEQTVNTHRKHIWKKLEIRSLAEAFRYAEVFGLLEY
jgi:DNA-binding CsgD family transcriptional regulator